MDNQHANILITGGSGVLGGAIVERLHGRPVTCLIHRNRIVPDHAAVIGGDLRQRAFGLTRGDYEELASRTSHIVHCAAATSFAARPDVVNAVNLETTSRILEFANAADAQMIHISTAFVARAATGVPIPGQTVDAGASVAAGIGAYVSSKRNAERKVVDSGLPAVIVRPSLITGDSTTGAIPHFQGIHLIPKFLFDGKLPLLPADKHTLIDFLPRDRVADAVVAVLDIERPDGEYWLTAGGRALTLEQVVALIERFAAETGKSVVSPRFVAKDIVDRLIRPVFLEHLPGPSRRRFEFLLALLELFESPEPFPSDTDQLLLGVKPDLEAAYLAGLGYWASLNKPGLELGRAS